MIDLNNTYKCAICGGIFEKELTDEEAKKELNEKFPGFSVDECDIVCDDCYAAMGFGDEEELQ